MPGPSYPKNDPYLKRMSVFGGIAALVLVVGALVGPSSETVERWILERHIGAEGPTEILPNLDIIPNEMPVNQQRLEHMSSATEGLAVQEEQATAVPDAEKKRPKSAEKAGRQSYSPLNLLTSESNTTASSTEERKEMHAPTQTSEDFVLERFVEPRYPEGASESARARIVEVRVGMYIDASGAVIEAYIVSSNGGRPFDEAVLDAVRAWEFRPIVDDPAGFWSEISFRFDFEEMTPRVEMRSTNQ